MKVGHTPEFLFDIYWWTWKTTIYWKNCWSGPIKNVSIFIFIKIKKTNKEIKKNTRRDILHTLYFTSFYTSVPKTTIIWGIVPQIHFTPKTTQKSKFWKHGKNTWRYHPFTYVYQKLWSDDKRFLTDDKRCMMDRLTDRETNGWTDRQTVPQIKTE